MPPGALVRHATERRRSRRLLALGRPIDGVRKQRGVVVVLQQASDDGPSASRHSAPSFSLIGPDDRMIFHFDVRWLAGSLGFIHARQHVHIRTRIPVERVPRSSAMTKLSQAIP